MTSFMQPRGRSPVIQGIEVNWERIGDLFPLDPAVTYLNHGAFGVVPVPVQRSQQRLRDEMDANPMGFFTRGLFERLAHTRQHVATFLGADPDGTALIPNASAGAQLALSAVDLHEGDEVLLTDHGYGAVRMAVERACRRTGARLTQAAIPLRANDDEVVARIVDAVEPGRTTFAIVDHITSPTAKLFPVARIVAALHERGVVVGVDAAHVPGMLDVEVAALGADFWFGNLHKWLFAPRPTAALVVAERFRERVRSLAVSWRDPEGFPAAVEYGGTLDYTSWLAAPTGIHFMRVLDPQRVRRNNVDLAIGGQRTIAAALNLDPPDLPGSDGVSMRLVPLPPAVADTLERALALQEMIAANLAVEVPVIAWNGHGYLRVCGQVYNRAEDYERLAAGLPRLLRAVAEDPGWQVA